MYKGTGSPRGFLRKKLWCKKVKVGGDEEGDVQLGTMSFPFDEFVQTFLPLAKMYDRHKVLESWFASMLELWKKPENRTLQTVFNGIMDDVAMTTIMLEDYAQYEDAPVSFDDWYDWVKWNAKELMHDIEVRVSTS
jgi:hypothetical protein